MVELKRFSMRAELHDQVHRLRLTEDGEWCLYKEAIAAIAQAKAEEREEYGVIISAVAELLDEVAELLDKIEPLITTWSPEAADLWAQTRYTVRAEADAIRSMGEREEEPFKGTYMGQDLRRLSREELINIVVQQGEEMLSQANKHMGDIERLTE